MKDEKEQRRVTSRVGAIQNSGLEREKPIVVVPAAEATRWCAAVAARTIPCPFPEKPPAQTPRQPSL
ncbi:MAG: hypothetical protein WB819_16950 [Terriglobia bacterium]